MGPRRSLRRRSTTRASTPTSRRPRRDAAAFRERYHGKVAELDAAGLAEAVAEHERIESSVVRPLTYAHLVFATNMADPARGALVARLGEKAAALETQLLFFALEWAAVDDDAAEALLADAALDDWRHHLRVAAQVPAVPALRAGGEDRHREDRLGRRGVVAALRGAARRAPGLARRRGASSLETAMARLYEHRPRRAARRRPRRSPRRSARACGRARSSSTRSCSTSRSTTGCAATRPGSRRATSRTRRPTRRSRRSSRRRRRATTCRSATTGSRRGCSGSTGSSTTTASRPSPTDAEKTSVGRGAADRRRRVRRLLGRGRRDRRALLRRPVDRRARPARQAHRRVLRDDRAGRPPVHPHELHRRPPLDPDARARARPRAARRALAAARPLQLVDAADDRRDRVGVRRGAHVRAAARRARTTRAAGSICSPGGSRTRSRRRSGRSR